MYVLNLSSKPRVASYVTLHKQLEIYREECRSKGKIVTNMPMSTNEQANIKIKERKPDHNN